LTTEEPLLPWICFNNGLGRSDHHVHVLRNQRVGRTCSALYKITIGVNETAQIRLRLSDLSPTDVGDAFKDFTETLRARKAEADEFYRSHTGASERG
jgi:hypothetical protein